MYGEILTHVLLWPSFSSCRLAQEGIVVGKGLPSHMRLSDPPQADAQVGVFFCVQWLITDTHLTLTLEVVYMGLTSLSGDAMKKHLTGFFKRGHSLNCLHWRYFWSHSSRFFLNDLT